MKYYEQILFLTVAAWFFYCSWTLNYDSNINYQKGLQSAALILIASGTLESYKAVQNEVDARQMLTHLYPELGKPVQSDMHTYDDNCQLNWQNISDNFDHYYIVHCCNWFLAALCVRDPLILHIWSILDEIIELSAQHRLPHFRECWWDHIGTDIILANSPAIHLGLFVIQIGGFKFYDWCGRKDKQSIKEWQMFKCHRRFGGICLIFFVIVVNFLNNFFLMNQLWVPPINDLNKFRLVIWFIMACLAFRELYNDVETWGKEERVNNPISGQCRWICLFIAYVETFISFKFVKNAGNITDEPTPVYIWLPWLVSCVGFGVFYLYLRLKNDHTTKLPAKYYEEKTKVY